MDINEADDLIRKANLLFKRGRFEGAKRLLDSAIQEDPSNEKLYFNLGLVHEARGEYEAAIDALEKAIQVSTSSVGIKWELGKVLYAAANVKEAIPYLRDCVAEWPERSQVYALLGRAYLELSMEDAASEALKTALAINDSDPDAVDGLVDFYNQQGMDGKVKGLLTEYIEKNPDLPSSHAFYADYLQYVEGDATGSLPYYEKSLMLCEDGKKLKWLRSFFSTSRYPQSIIEDYWIALMMSGYFDIARRLTNEHMKGVTKLYYEAFHCDELGQYQKKSRLLERALRDYPDDAFLSYLLAFEHLRQGEKQKAADLIDRAMNEVEGIDQDVRYRIVQLLSAQELDQKDFASSVQDKAVDLYGKEFWGSLSYHLKEMSRWEESLAACEKVLESDPEDVHVLGYKAEALRELGRHREALDVLDDLLSLRPKDGRLFIDMARTCLQISDYEQAQALLHRAESETNLSRPQKEEIAQLRSKISSQ